MKHLIAILLTVAVSAQVMAETKHEIIVSNTSSALTLGTGTDTFGLRAGWFYTLSENFQVGLLEATIDWALSGTKDFQYGFLGGFTFNSSGALSDAFYLSAGAGLKEVAGSSKFYMGADVGKRFEIIPNVTYRPGVGVRKNSASDWIVSLNLVSFSILL